MAFYHKIKNLVFHSSILDILNPKTWWIFAKIRPYTMASFAKLMNILALTKKIEYFGIPGAYVECGVWKGGCGALMAYQSEHSKASREIWLFDSFEGLPEPSPIDGKEAISLAKGRSSGNLKSIDECKASEDEVKRLLFEILRLQKDQIHIEKGWFQNTLPKTRSQIGTIAILRLDGDWYESTKCCLENLYDLVSLGGFVILDDYGFWEGSRKAVHDFFQERDLDPELVAIDRSGYYFQKI